MLAQTVILCGGLGARLGPLTAHTPKPLLEVAGRPFLEVLIAEAARFGTRDIVLLAGRFGEQIFQRYDGTSYGTARVRVRVEPEPMGTAGALRFALPLLERDFLLMNGDSWIDADLAVFSRSWRKTPDAAIQMLLQHVPDAARFGSVEEQGGRITAFREKNLQRDAVPGWINAGVYALQRSVVDALPRSGSLSLETDVLPGLVESGSARAVRAPEGRYFIDIGLPETFAQAQTEIDNVRRRPAFFFDRDGTLNRDTGYTRRVEDLRWTQDAREAIRLANAAGYYVFVVTNQAGVARGLYNENAIERFHLAMQEALFKIGAHIDDIAWCPHHPEGSVAAYSHSCDCRKPAAGMLRQLMACWPVDAPRSLMIGDHEKDMQAAAAAGLTGRLYSGGSLVEIIRGFLNESGEAKHVG
ncbi:MAG: HAD-IIIA family hydrolase [Rhodobacteraceae bacterium]|nr:HAD-IIIA family hydrolase [Paracoccaceae bacterium]MCZ8085549.1 HAD-IIIA family hydrolase [Paracoccaceae bacterium]